MHYYFIRSGDLFAGQVVAVVNTMTDVRREFRQRPKALRPMLSASLVDVNNDRAALRLLLLSYAKGVHHTEFSFGEVLRVFVPGPRGGPQEITAEVLS
ncbi:MAG: hypothetical protein WC972_02495 [Trueperaceae bacterium]